MGISTFKGTVPVEDWSQLGNKIDQSVNLYTNLRKAKEDEAKKDQKESEAKYLNLAKIDPVYTSLTYWQKEQGKEIENFNKFLGQVYYDSQNNPSLQDQIKIQNRKQAFLGWQQKLTADQKRYQMAISEIKKDPNENKYDHNNFKEKVQKWKDEGELDEDLLLPPLIEDLKSHNIAKKYTGKMQQNGTIIGSTEIIRESVPENQRKANVINDLFNNSSEFRTAVKKFDELTYDDKKQWLTKYPGNKDKNAISEYYYETFGKYAYPDIVNKKPVKGKSVQNADELMSGSVDYNNPTDKIKINPVTATVRTGEKDEKGKEDTYQSSPLDDADQYGKGFNFKPGSFGSIMVNNYIDPTTGHETKEDSPFPVQLKDIQIKHVPYKDGYGIPPYGKYDKNKYDGTLKVQGVVITYDEKGNAKYLKLTDEIKDKIIKKYPKLKDRVMEIKNDFIPKSDQEPSNLETKKEVNYKLGKGEQIGKNKTTGKTALFRNNEFVKWLD